MNIFFLLNKKKYTFTLLCFIFFILVLINLNCDVNNPREGPPLMFNGIIIDSVSGAGIDSAIIATKYESDSLIFVGDSLISENYFSRSYYSWQFRDKHGYFLFYYRSYDRPPFEYSALIAYKSGYHIWRFNAQRDTVFRQAGRYDSLVIRMVKK